MTSVSVVICTTGRLAELTRCLRALGPVAPPDEVLLVASGCQASALTPVIEEQRIRVVAGPVGLSRARNLGAAQARGDIIAYLDDDAQPLDSWLEHVRRAFDRPEISAACGPVFPLRPAAEGTATLPANRNRAAPVTIDRATDDWVWLINFGGVLTGSNMAVRRTVFDRHRFHPSLGRGAVIDGGEEHYLFYGIVRDGGAVHYDPAIAIRHHLPIAIEEVRRAVRRRSRAVTAYLGFLMIREPATRVIIGRRVLQWLFRAGSGTPGIPRPRPRLRGMMDLASTLVGRSSSGPPSLPPDSRDQPD